MEKNIKKEDKIHHLFNKQLEKEEIDSLLFKNLNKKFKVILIHGPSSSGKTTFANTLSTELRKKYRVYTLHLDSYYKNIGFKENYDFDNPAALEWSEIHKTLRAIHDESEKIPEPEYCFISHKRKGIKYKQNIKPEIIIIEGIFALNIFNEQIFDLDFYTCINQKKGDKFIENKEKYPYFGILKIRLSTCKEYMKNIRINRDLKERGRHLESIKEQFNKNVWPSTKRWVNNKIFSADINLIHGTFNTEKYHFLLEKIFDFFDKNGQKTKKKVFPKINFICSQECYEERKRSQLYLLDELRKE